MESTLSPFIADLLLQWYGENKRNLPWRENPSPYRVWVSEIMLQQTRVEAVKEKYLRFMEALPTLQDLAEVPEQQLLKLWEGLGYYSRARNLQKGAKVVVQQFQGELPGDVKSLLSIPGIGPYTAGAIASIAFGLPVPAVDGNVMRVLSRLLAWEESPTDTAAKRLAGQWLSEIMPPASGDFNQAIMDLGAMVCLPAGKPLCQLCPLADLCVACQRQQQTLYPVMPEKKPREKISRTLFLLIKNGKAGLCKRPSQGLLANLWELPGVDGALSEEEAKAQLFRWGFQVSRLEKLKNTKHIFTHLEWHMSCWAAEVKGEGVFTWVTKSQLAEEFPLPSAFKGYRKEMENRLS